MIGSTRIPVLLLTGFLGSGKTTLLNRLMHARPPSPGKLAVVVNELGAVGIDGDLLPGSMTRQVELPGGCICCILNEELDTTLLELLDGTPDIEAIVIETTGIAEPLPIAWSLGREPLSDRVRLAAVITVVDVANFEQSRPLSPGVDAQVEYADILVLSKLDVLGLEEPPAGLMGVLQDLNPAALRVAGTPEQVTAALWRAVADPALPETQPERPPEPHGSARESHAHQHGGAHGFDSVWLPIDTLIDFEELAESLESLPANYVRIKGIAHAIDRSTGSSVPGWLAFHRVGTRVSCEPLTAPARGRIVAVGPGVERPRLAACLQAAVVPCES